MVADTLNQNNKVNPLLHKTILSSSQYSAKHEETINIS